MFGDISRINNNYHAQQAVTNLKKVNGDIGKIQSRLSSGKKINNAEDDSSGYALAKNLESRTRGLAQALDNIGNAKNIISIAEGGYQSQMSILQDIKEKLTHAADGSLSNVQRGSIGDQIHQLLIEFSEIATQTKFNGNKLFTTGDNEWTDWDDTHNNEITFQVGENQNDRFVVKFDNSNRTNVGEGSIDLDFIVTDPNFAYTVQQSENEWSNLTQIEAQNGISTMDLAIKDLTKTIQRMGDYQARLSSKEESVSVAISNTENARSRVEDSDIAKEQMSMMKLQILQQTTISSFTQSNSNPQMILSIFR